MNNLTPPARILLLDGDAASADRVRHLLDAAGFVCILDHAGTAADALAALRVSEHDLIIAADLPPELDCLALWRQARACRPGIPVVVFSDAPDEDAIVQMLSDGGSEYVAKSHAGRLAPIVRRKCAECDGCRKQHATQAALDAVDGRLRDIAESLPGGIYQFIRRPDGVFYFAYLSQRCAEITGVTESGEGTRADPDFARILPDDLPRVMESIAVSAAALQPWEEEFRLVADGGIRWLRGMAMPRGMDDGGVMWTGIFFDITELKAQSQALAASEHYNRILFEHSPIGLALSRMNGELVDVNPAFAAILGLTVAATLDLNYWHITPLEYAEQEQAQLASLLNLGRYGPYEKEYMHRDGHRVPVRLQGMRIELRGESYIWSSVEDITGLKAAETELRRAQTESAIALYRRAMEASSVSMSIADATAPDLPLIYINPAFERITGYASAEVLGRNCRFLQGAEQDQAGLVEIRAALAEARDGRALLRNYRKDGSPFWNELIVTPVHDGGGKLTHFIGISQDVSQRLEMETALKTSEARLRSVLESVVDGIVVIDERGIVESFNPAAESIFGYTFEEVHGRNVSLLMPEPYASAHDGYLHNYLETGRERIIGIGREVTGRRKDGSTFPMDLAVNAMRAGEKRCFTGIVRDITERKRLDWEMIRALEAALSASRAKSEFLSSMSHELRTPMNAILGFGQLLQMDRDLSAEQADSAREIVKAGRHLLTLINEVLDLARIESGNLTLSMEPVELVELIDECAVLVESGAIRQGLAFERDMAPCLGRWVRADRLRLKQVLINLLSNAVKYNRAGGSVRIACEFKATGQVRLAVSDTGPGIPEDKLADLFTPFNRLGLEAGSIEGSGIGLVISKRLVEMMGGEIGVDSRPGQGCTFWVELARAEPFAAPATATPTEAAHAATSGMQCYHTVLYVEDNPANLRLMQQVLAPRADIRLLSSGEPLVGLELARDEHPDLIMLDINLPGMSGYEMLKQLQADADTRDIPVLAISANAMPEDIERGLAAGFRAYLTKPLDLARLQMEINRLLG
ncbi:MAG: hypothetical protein B7Y41_16550 [Hydrogenophilales bacterium 28-61-23]|nr:MAG: hypothetical protein B7Y41_16550 [Hydrogenophilales bacterium 28-61-23]